MKKKELKYKSQNSQSKMSYSEPFVNLHPKMYTTNTNKLLLQNLAKRTYLRFCFKGINSGLTGKRGGG